MAVVYAKKIDGKLEELGRTEVVLNSLHPEWIEKVPIRDCTAIGVSFSNSFKCLSLWRYFLFVGSHVLI